MWVILQGASRLHVQHVPRHSEVDQESPTRLETDNQILAASIDCGDAFAPELGRDLDRIEGTCQPCVGDLDLLEAAACELRLEPATDGLDFRKLGHRTRVVAGCPVATASSAAYERS